MVTYNEYLDYFERFVHHLDNNKLCNMTVHYLKDSVIISDFSMKCHTVHLKIECNTIIETDFNLFRSYGNNLHFKTKHDRSDQFNYYDAQLLNWAGYWFHYLPDINLKSIRFSALRCSRDKFLLLFRRIYDDYRMRTETFPIYDLQIKYYSFTNCQ